VGDPFKVPLACDNDSEPFILQAATARPRTMARPAIINPIRITPD
jgi:hypothetical protein